MKREYLRVEDFPALSHSVRAKWAPLLLCPISGSYEQLVVGVAVAGNTDYHLEIANRLSKLHCLYDSKADGAIYAVQLAAEFLNNQLATLGAEALSISRPSVTGFTLGQVRDGEGKSLEAIAKSWLQNLSSLQSPEQSIDIAADTPIYETKANEGQTADQLPTLVLKYVADHREGLQSFFSSSLRQGKVRRGRNHEIMIDFAGSRLVANFGTLKANSIGPSVNLIKRRLWDLKVERDRDDSASLTRHHEMILQTPANNDPQVNDRQRDKLSEALHALELQADQEQLRLRPLPTVETIGQRIIEAEAA